ncbi:pyrroline-5-carboxylate reductase dimerization domain-containing protein [Fusibacter bizertensis]
MVRCIPADIRVSFWLHRLLSLFDINKKIENDDLIDFFNLLNPVSTLHRVKSDEEFNRLGTLTSCSPGLLCEVFECFLSKFSILQQDEQKLFYQSIRGTVNYLLNTNKNINDVSLEVANKGGLTEVGIKTLNELFPACMDQVVENMQNKINDRSTQISITMETMKKSINKKL